MSVSEVPGLERPAWSFGSLHRLLAIAFIAVVLVAGTHLLRRRPNLLTDPQFAESPCPIPAVRRYDSGRMLTDTMPSDAEQGPEAADVPGLDRAVEALTRGVEILRSLSLHEEAREVTALVERLGAGRAGIGHSVFRREGEYRLILYESDVFRLKETLGLSYLATLLAHPGREIHVLELVGSDAVLASDAGPVLDREARQAYRERIEELRAELTEAERFNDPERAARHRQELELLRAELLRGEGFGGRERASGSTSERARQAATKALKSALVRIAAESPSLSRHLASTVRTGTYCRYDPDPRLPISWRL